MGSTFDWTDKGSFSRVTVFPRPNLSTSTDVVTVTANEFRWNPNRNKEFRIIHKDHPPRGNVYLLARRIVNSRSAGSQSTAYLPQKRSGQNCFTIKDGRIRHCIYWIDAVQPEGRDEWSNRMTDITSLRTLHQTLYTRAQAKVKKKSPKWPRFDLSPLCEWPISGIAVKYCVV